VLVIFGAGIGLATAEVAPPATNMWPRPYPEHLAWWAEGRFGMFIHWGPVSLKGTEISWSRANTNPKCPNQGAIPAAVYDKLYQEFNPTNFDAGQWMDTARAAGVRYAVLTAKHCDGFLLWHSKASDYNISATPFGRDICAELAAAARKKGLRIGWYFSPMDWRDPDFRTERNGVFLRKMRTELTELLGNYGPIDLLWFDWDGKEPVYDQAGTYTLVASLQPKMVINNRLDLGPTNNDRQILSRSATYYTPEQSVGAYDDQRPWESCMTLSAKNQWAWGGPEDGVKSLATCLQMLIRCAGGDGNLLLNIGPRPDGRIDPAQASRLKEMGDWLQIYGESIYGTRGGPYKPGAYGVATRKGKTIYLHFTDWIEDSWKLPPLAAKVVGSRVLGRGTVRVGQSSAGLVITVDPADRQPIDTVVALELDQEANLLAAIEVPPTVSLAAKAKITASNVYQNLVEFRADQAVDGNAETRWATDGGVRQAWLELDLGEPKSFSRARIAEAFPNRVQKFELQQFSDGAWKTFFTGRTLGESWVGKFPTVNTRRVRLNIMEATDGPTLWEVQLFQ
jgi:alpha-L-fucosidase